MGFWPSAEWYFVLLLGFFAPRGEKPQQRIITTLLPQAKCRWGWR